MSEAYLTIEKLCLEALHRNTDSEVCNFVRGNYRYVSDSYCVWILPENEANVVCSTHVNYPENKDFLHKVENLIEKYRGVESYPLRSDDVSVIYRDHTISEYVCTFTGDEVWIQDKYVKSFEPFDGELHAIPNCQERIEPVIVKSNGEMIGLIMPMRVIRDYKEKRDQIDIFHVK